jgi:outer membrane protein assembly factor BamB
MRARPALLGLALLAGCTTVQLQQPLLPEPPAAAVPAPPLERAWEVNVQGGFGPGAALLAGGHVIVGTRRGELYVIRADTGARVGSLRVAGSINGTPALSEDGRVLYLPASDGGVVAYGLVSGRTLWRWRGGPVSAGVTLAGGHLIAATRDGALVGLDPLTGAERWTFQARAEDDASAQFHAAPVTVGADVLVADDRGTVRRVDGATGALRWAAPVGAPVYHTPAAADGLLAVPTTRGTLVVLRLADGAERWRAAIGVAGRTRVSTPAVSGGRLFVGGSDGSVRAFDAASGAALWTHSSDGNVRAQPLAIGPLVYVGTLGRRLVALDAADGTERWRTTLRGRLKSAMLSTGTHLVALTEPSHVIAFTAQPFADTTATASR